MQYTKHKESHMYQFYLTYFNYKFKKRNKIASKETIVSKDLEYVEYANEDGAYVVHYSKHDPINSTAQLYKKPKV